VTKLERRETRAEMKFSYFFASLRVMSADVLSEENTRISYILPDGNSFAFLLR
jgi:hypothetical protein